MIRHNKVIPLVVFILVVSPCMFFLTPVFAVEDDVVSEWLDRVEFSMQLETDKKPTYYFQTVQPLYQDETKTNTIFVQPRVSLRDERTMYNLGFGYRRLVSDNLILGINTFGDYQDKSKHGRVGVGVEALGQIFEARMNSYFGGITSKRNIVETSSGLTMERVVDGMDLEFGAPLPYLPWLKMYGSGSWYDYKESRDRVGWKARMEAKINDYTRLEFYTWDDNKGDVIYGGQVRVNIAFHSWADIFDFLKFSEEAFPEKDLTEELLIPVERNHDIVVEKYITNAGLTIEAGRGNS